MRKEEEGYSLVALLASITVMLTLMAMALPSWRYVMKDAKEEELIFRGGQIADGIGRFQRKNGGALPTSLDILVKGKFLRKAYKDPMTPDGRWRFVRPGEPMPGMGRPGQPGQPPLGMPTPPPVSQGGLGWRPLGDRPGSQTTMPTGPFLGVASLSQEKSLRRFNNREKYSEWFFVTGQPRMVGELPAPGSAPLTGPGGMPGGMPGRARPGGINPPPTIPGGVRP